MDYWQIRFAVLERDVKKKQAEEALAEVMIANGLDPKRNYTMNDADKTVTPKDSPNEPQAG